MNVMESNYRGIYIRRTSVTIGSEVTNNLYVQFQKYVMKNKLTKHYG